MAKRSLDNVRGSWIALTALACAGVIFALGLGSERVRRVVRDHLPAALGGTPRREAVLLVEPAEKSDAGKGKEDPNALPEVPKEDSLRGLVKDSAGRPVPGASISAERWRESRWESLGTARANAKGEFVLGPVPRAHLSAVARAEGYASERKPAKTGARLEFTLKKGGTLAGKVVDAVTGEPVPDAYLSGWSARWDWNEQARTDREGAFRFLSVPPGRVWLNVAPRDHRATSISDLEIHEGKETLKEIPVVRGGSLRGRVVDRETRAPVPGARIRTWDGVKSATSGEDGRYEIPSYPAGGVSLKVSAAPDYPEQWSWFPISGDPGQDVEREIEVSRGCRVSGVVVRPDGSPAAGARVGKDPGEILTGVPDNATVADAEGRFALDSVPAWRGLRLFAVAEGFALSRSDTLDLRPGAEFGGVHILLQAGATFRGSVKDEEGRPLAAASVAFQRWWTPADGGNWFWIPEMVAYSLADGTWELSGVPQGTWQIRVNLEGYAPESRGNVVAPADGAVEGQDFLLRRGSSITGRVRSLAGELLPGVSVAAWGWVAGSEGRMEWVQRSEVRTDEEGVFVLDGLRDGTYQIDFRLPGHAPLQLPGISTGSRDLQVTLLPTARIEGRVLEADGVTPVPNFTLRLYLEVDSQGNPQPPGNAFHQQDFADREGMFVCRDLPEGQVAVVAASGNRISRRQGGLVLRAGAVLDGLRLTVAPGGKLRVTVRDASGAALRGSQVSAGRLQPGGSFAYEHWAQTDAEGVADFAAMADGQWTLWANHPKGVQETRTVVVGGGVEAEVEMVLRLGGSVLVLARDPEGRPVAGAEVAFLESATGQEIPLDWGRVWQKASERSGGRVDWNRVQREATRTDAEGRLLREGLRGGEVRVRLRGGGFVEKTAAATVLDGFEIDLPVTLEPAKSGTTGPAPEGGGGH